MAAACCVAPCDRPWLPPHQPQICLHQPSTVQDVFASQNCTYGFDAAALKQQLKDVWGVDVWLTCNAE